MDQKCDRLYPSAPFENIDLEEKLEKKVNDINSFNNSVNNIKEMITYFEDKNNKSKKKIKKTITTILKSIDTIVISATTSNSSTLFLTGIGLIVIPISTTWSCGLSIGNKVLFEIIINKYNKCKKQYEKDQQTIFSFNKLYRKSLQDNVIDKSEYESLCKIFTKYVARTKYELFKNYEYKKISFFSNKKIKLNLEPRN